MLAGLCNARGGRAGVCHVRAGSEQRSALVGCVLLAQLSFLLGTATATRVPPAWELCQEQLAPISSTPPRKEKQCAGVCDSPRDAPCHTKQRPCSHTANPSFESKCFTISGSDRPQCQQPARNPKQHLTHHTHASSLPLRLQLVQLV